MGIFAALKTGIFAAKIASCLLDLGIDVKKLNPEYGRVLYEIERDKSKEFSPHEAALYFLAGALPNINQSCYLLPIDRHDLANRAEVIAGMWVKAGKIRAPVADAMFQTLRSSPFGQLRE